MIRSANCELQARGRRRTGKTPRDGMRSQQAVVGVHEGMQLRR